MRSCSMEKWVTLALSALAGCGGTAASSGALPPPEPIDATDEGSESAEEVSRSCGFAAVTELEEERHLRETAPRAPVRVPSIADAVEIDVFLERGCARRQSGTVACFDLRTGEVTEVPGLTDARSVVLAHHGGCATRDSSGVTCWSGLAPPPATPLVESLGTIAAGSSLTPGGPLGAACAIAPGGSATCFGVSYGSSLTVEEPRSIGEVGAVRDLALSEGMACALRADGTVLCEEDDAPVSLTGLPRTEQIAAGAEHACARTRDGEVLCWGSTEQGAIGDGTTSPRSRPTRVALPARARDVATGVMHTCAALESGEVHCWGYNAYGQLGDGSFTARPAPVRVAGLEGAVAVSAHLRNTCALLRDGTVACWGALAMCLAGDCAR